LIGGVESKVLTFKSCADAQEMPVEVSNQRVIICVGYGVFVVNVAGADRPAIVEISGRSELVVPARFPIKRERDVLRHDRREARLLVNIYGSNPPPVGVVRVEFEIPRRGRPIRNSENRT